MVIERFKHGDATLIGERFKRNGRMLPEGVAYHASWVDSAGTRCFQVMEASHPELMNLWVSRWDDLVDFEIVPVVTASDFWAKMSEPCFALTRYQNLAPRTRRGCVGRSAQEARRAACSVQTAGLQQLTSNSQAVNGVPQVHVRSSMNRPTAD